MTSKSKWVEELNYLLKKYGYIPSIKGYVEASTEDIDVDFNRLLKVAGMKYKPYLPLVVRKYGKKFDKLEKEVLESEVGQSNTGSGGSSGGTSSGDTGTSTGGGTSGGSSTQNISGGSSSSSTTYNY